MSEDNSNEGSNNSEGSRTKVVLALIGLVGTIVGVAGTVGVALVENWDKVTPVTPPESSVQGGAQVSVEPSTPADTQASAPTSISEPIPIPLPAVEPTQTTPDPPPTAPEPGATSTPTAPVAGATLANLPSCAELQALHSWWSPSREENFTTSDPRWSDALGATREPDYTMFRIEGMVYTTQKPGTIPLYSWYSPSREDNFLTSDPRWAGAAGDTQLPDYVFVRVEGYIHDPGLQKPESDSLVRLNSFWSPSREENFATSDPQWGKNIGDGQAPDYSLYRHEGFLYSDCAAS